MSQRARSHAGSFYSRFPRDLMSLGLLMHGKSRTVHHTRLSRCPARICVQLQGRVSIFTERQRPASSHSPGKIEPEAVDTWGIAGRLRRARKTRRPIPDQRKSDGCNGSLRTSRPTHPRLFVRGRSQLFVCCVWHGAGTRLEAMTLRVPEAPTSLQHASLSDPCRIQRSADAGAGHEDY